MRDRIKSNTKVLSHSSYIDDEEDIRTELLADIHTLGRYDDDFDVESALRAIPTSATLSVSSALKVAQNSASRADEIEDMLARERDDMEAAREHESHIRERELERMASKIKADVHENLSVSINSAMKVNTAAVREAITTSVNNALSQHGIDPGNALGRDNFDYYPDHTSVADEHGGEFLGNSLQKQQAYQDVTGLIPKQQQVPYQPREGYGQGHQGQGQNYGQGQQGQGQGYRPYQHQQGYQQREGYQQRYNNGFQQNRGIPYPRGQFQSNVQGGIQPLAYTPPEYCNTCGQTHTACNALGAKIEDTGGAVYCPLREKEANGRVSLETNKLNKLMLAELDTAKFNQVMEAAAKFGCLSNLSKEALDAYKYEFKNHREAIKESLGTSRGSV